MNPEEVTIPISCMDCGESGTVTASEDILAWMEAHPCTARKPRKRAKPDLPTDDEVA